MQRLLAPRPGRDPAGISDYFNKSNLGKWPISRPRNHVFRFRQLLPPGNGPGGPFRLRPPQLHPSVTAITPGFFAFRYALSGLHPALLSPFLWTCWRTIFADSFSLSWRLPPFIISFFPRVMLFLHCVLHCDHTVSTLSLLLKGELKFYFFPYFCYKGTTARFF